MQRLGRGVPVAGVIAVAASLVFFSGMALATPAKTVAKSAAKPAAKTAVQPAPDVVLRHMLSGQAQDTLASLVMRFNEEQKGRIRVVVQNMGALDDAERRRLPSMALLEPDDSMLFFRDKPKFKPLYQVMTTNGQRLEAGQFFPLVADAVDDGAGRIQALPLGLSLPVLMWNKDELRKAGLDPEEPPQSWFDVQMRAGKLYDEGSACPLTSSRFSWIHLENVSTQHGEPLLVRDKGRAMRARLNSMVDIKHLALLSSWYKARYFQYFGPGSEADHRFLSGECAMITGESALYQEARRAGIAVGMSPMPFYDDMHGANRERILPGGMGLWALAGRSAHEYQGVAQFVRFMLRPEVQNEWLRGTGFLPMTPVAMRTLESLDVPPPLVNLATRRLGEASPAKLRTKHNAGLSQLRSIVDEEVADVWANRKPAKQALDIAMRRAGGGAP
ncbi:putative sn-glycerol-3-phosphate-binding periplasmic protein UgpB [Sterolibacterium denitrificans]|uniref:sn-glycerol-3-phosphate-binding periplasmic protein UgpB n=1 Tax=Sterolibacterium denitrificans TaxID=157592 RepID=A0A7Z7HS68_9PROT|nr:extracellular solute-binding protein [Sterolibacterium denitrificans]SMB29175.1 putative sn-glycerol-3-phosphate-binding periplasmic protein UgpB [Sterolibacterium denitrificans]